MAGCGWSPPERGGRLRRARGGRRGAAIDVPDGLSLRDAVALLADGRTALSLVGRAGLAAVETVLVETAGGGVGTLLVQLARQAGARVVALAGHPGKLARPVTSAPTWPSTTGTATGRIWSPRRLARSTWFSTALAGRWAGRRSGCSARAAGSTRSAWPAGASRRSRGVRDRARGHPAAGRAGERRGGGRADPQGPRRGGGGPAPAGGWPGVRPGRGLGRARRDRGPGHGRQDPAHRPR